MSEWQSYALASSQTNNNLFIKVSTWLTNQPTNQPCKAIKQASNQSSNQPSKQVSKQPINQSAKEASKQANPNWEPSVWSAGMLLPPRHTAYLKQEHSPSYTRPGVLVWPGMEALRNAVTKSLSSSTLASQNIYMYITVLRYAFTLVCLIPLSAFLLRVIAIMEHSDYKLV